MLGELDKNEKAVAIGKQVRSNFNRLMTIKPKPVSIEPGVVVQISDLKPGETLPLVIRPVAKDVNLINWASNNRDLVEQNLLKAGAILFRGFNLDGTSQFEQFAQIFTPELFSENGEHPRQTISGKVSTPVFYPSEKKILWHNENSFNDRWPTKIWFQCVVAAAQGGETPLADARKVFNLIDPEVREVFIRKGVMYERNYGCGLGLDWQTVFRTTSKFEAEQRCRENLMEFEWKAGDRLSTRAIRPAVVKHPKTGEYSWFNQAQHWHISCLDPTTRMSLLLLFTPKDLPRNCYYGDGSTIEDETMNHILEVYQQLETSFTWQSGDILMVENLLTAHARNPFAGERKHIVAMGNMLSYSDV